MSVSIRADRVRRADDEDDNGFDVDDDSVARDDDDDDDDDEESGVAARGIGELMTNAEAADMPKRRRHSTHVAGHTCACTSADCAWVSCALLLSLSA